MTSTQPATTPGVIFDLDGTLADTLADITDSINIAFAQAGLEPVTLGRIRALIGEGLTNLLRRASGLEDPERLASLVEAYRSVYRNRMLCRSRLYPGIEALLDKLTERHVPVAVLSNKPDEFTVPICAALLSAWPVVMARGSVEEALKKPDPTVALDLAKLMQRSPAEIFFVGDSTVDIQTGQCAGMTPIAVTWGYRDRPELEAAGPAWVVESPSELCARLITA